MIMFLWHMDLNIDRVRTNVANNAMMGFSMTILVDGSSDVIILIIGQGIIKYAQCSCIFAQFSSIIFLWR